MIYKGSAILSWVALLVLRILKILFMKQHTSYTRVMSAAQCRLVAGLLSNCRLSFEIYTPRFSLCPLGISSYSALRPLTSYRFWSSLGMLFTRYPPYLISIPWSSNWEGVWFETANSIRVSIGGGNLKSETYDRDKATSETC